MLMQPGFLTLEQLHAIHAGGITLELPAESRQAIRASQQVVQRAADGDAPVYGVNTGFGKLANQRISKAQLDTLQLNLIQVSKADHQVTNLGAHIMARTIGGVVNLAPLIRNVWGLDVVSGDAEGDRVAGSSAERDRLQLVGDLPRHHHANQ